MTSTLKLKATLTLTLGLLAYGFPAAARPTPNTKIAVAAKSRAEFCQAIKDQFYFQKLLRNSANRLAFTNGAYGLASGGVCWWHSRLQRSALYLAVFRPDRPKPSRQLALNLIERLKSMNQVVEIPGYSNISEFSADYSREMISSLESWQLSDGVLGGGWINGASRVPYSPAQNWTYVKALKQRTDIGRIPIIVVNNPNSILSHSALVLDVRTARDVNTSPNVADVTILDPNYSFLGEVSVTSAHNAIYMFPITVLSYENDVKSFYDAQACYCHKKCATTQFNPFAN